MILTQLHSRYYFNLQMCDDFGETYEECGRKSVQIWYLLLIIIIILNYLLPLSSSPVLTVIYFYCCPKEVVYIL